MDFLFDFFAYVPGKNFLFTSLDFWIFLTLVLGGFSLLYKNRPARNTFLFVCSLFFYYKIGGYFVFILLLSILFNYGIGLRIENTERSMKHFWLAVGILANLLLLGIFKYDRFWGEIWGYFSDPTNGIAFLSPSAEPTDIPYPKGPIQGISSAMESLFPAIGLSFFTFQALSYLIDIKRKKIAACRNIGDFGLYLSFFPQLVAGPIVRAGQFLPQLQKNYMLSSGEFSKALGLILTGLIKKIIVADYLAIHLTDPVLEAPRLFSGFENWMAMYAFALRIYCDFSAYTDIALGVAALFDFHLPQNFRSPYKASSLSDFWHRWHISLSSWFRDYVYIPLGGNRHGLFQMGIALITTMILAGLWHGASLGFLLWGLLHGILLLLEKVIGWNRWINRTQLSRALGWFVCFHIVGLGWILFQAPNLEYAVDVFEQMLRPTSWEDMGRIIFLRKEAFSIMVLGFVFMLLVKERRKENLARIFHKAPLPVKFAISAAIIALLLGIRHLEVQDFLYLRF